MELNLQGKASLVSEEGLHQLHIFIFVLAVMQIVYSVLTMGLGRAKVRTLCATKIDLTIYLYASHIRGQFYGYLNWSHNQLISRACL